MPKSKKDVKAAPSEQSLQDTIKSVTQSLNFTSESESLSDLLREHSLPRVVVCDAKTLGNDTGNNSHISQPLLLHQKSSSRKTRGMTLVYDRQNKDFRVVGRELVIPSGYAGYFAVLGSLDACSKDHAVPYFSQVGKLAISPCKTFLIGGNEPIDAYRVEGTSKRNPTACSLHPGDVMRKGGILEATAQATPRKKLFKKKDCVVKEQFIQCYDKLGREFLISGKTQGAFYILDQDGAPLKYPVLTMSQILKRFQLPLVVKLVFGLIPPAARPFSGTLLLTDSALDHTVLGATLFGNSNVSIELPLDTGLKFFSVDHNPGLLGSRTYNNALLFCQRNLESYINCIKVDPDVYNSRTDQYSNTAATYDQYEDIENTHYIASKQKIVSSDTVGQIGIKFVESDKHTMFVPFPQQSPNLTPKPLVGKNKEVSTPRIDLSRDYDVKKLFIYLKPESDNDVIPIQHTPSKVNVQDPNKGSHSKLRPEYSTYESLIDEKTEQKRDENMNDSHEMNKLPNLSKVHEDIPASDHYECVCDASTHHVESNYVLMGSGSSLVQNETPSHDGGNAYVNVPSNLNIQRSDLASTLYIRGSSQSPPDFPAPPPPSVTESKDKSNISNIFSFGFKETDTKYMEPVNRSLIHDTSIANASHSVYAQPSPNALCDDENANIPVVIKLCKRDKEDDTFSSYMDMNTCAQGSPAGSILYPSMKIDPRSSTNTVDSRGYHILEDSHSSYNLYMNSDSKDSNEKQYETMDLPYYNVIEHRYEEFDVVCSSGFQVPLDKGKQHNVTDNYKEGVYVTADMIESEVSPVAMRECYDDGLDTTLDQAKPNSLISENESLLQSGDFNSENHVGMYVNFDFTSSKAHKTHSNDSLRNEQSNQPITSVTSRMGNLDIQTSSFQPPTSDQNISPCGTSTMAVYSLQTSQQDKTTTVPVYSLQTSEQPKASTYFTQNSADYTIVSYDEPRLQGRTYQMSQLKAPKKDISDRNSFDNSIDKLEASGEFKKLTLKSIKELDLWQKETLFSSTLEIYELQPLLPKVGHLELNKLRLFLSRL